MLLVVYACLVAIVGAWPDSTSSIRMAICSKGFSINCLKLDLIGIVAKAGGGGSYQLFPGVSLSHNLSSVAPPDLLRAVQEGNATSQDLDSFVSSTVSDYLSSITLSVKVLDQSSVNRARSISDRILSSVLPLETGRKKGGYGGALWAAGTLAAVGMAALAALSGKAMMTSMLALMMAGVSTLRNGNSNSKGCHTSHHVIDTHARAIELEKLAALEPMEVYTVDGPTASTHLKQGIPTYMMNH